MWTIYHDVYKSKEGFRELRFKFQAGHFKFQKAAKAINFRARGQENILQKL
jgi:hypothetical protein